MIIIMDSVVFNICNVIQLIAKTTACNRNCHQPGYPSIGRYDSQAPANGRLNAYLPTVPIQAGQYRFFIARPAWDINKCSNVPLLQEKLTL